MDFENITIHDIDMTRFSMALLVEDDLGSVIRCHFEAERALDHALSVFTEGRSSKSKLLRYFGHKLDALSMLGLDERFLLPMRTLNRVRNDFAHRGVDKITDKDLSEIRDAIGRVAPQMLQDFDIRIRGRFEFEGKYSTLNLRQKFVVSSLHATALLGGVPDIVRQAAAQMGVQPPFKAP